MKAVYLFLYLSHLVASSDSSTSLSSESTPGPIEFTGQPLRIGDCTVSTPTAFILTPTPTSINNDGPSPSPTTFSYLFQGCDASHPDCCPYPANDTTILSSPIAQCPEDYATLSNPYNTAQSSLCCPIGWQIFPTPLPDVPLYPCYNGSDDMGNYETSPIPLTNGNTTNSANVQEVLYVVITPAFELEPPPKEPRGAIIGVSIAGALFGCLLVTLWSMNRHMKRVKRKIVPVSLYRPNRMKNWRGELSWEMKDVEKNGLMEKGKGKAVVVSSNEVLE